MTKNKNHGAVSLVLMIIISCMTQVLTLLKSTVVAGHFGISVEMDAFNFANSIVSFVFGFVSAAISTVVIPKYASNYSRKAVDSFITLLYGILGGIVAFLIIFRYPIISAFSNKGDEYTFYVCDIMLILLVANYLFSLTYVTTGFYQCIGKYNVPKVLNALMQALVVASLYFFRDITISQYALIIAIGFLTNVLFDIIIAVKVGWRYRPTFSFGSDETTQLFKLFFPIIVSTGVYRISLFTDSIIASKLETGQLSILGYSMQIVSMVNAILVGNLLMYAYPKIVKFVQKSNTQTKFWGYVSFFHLIICMMISGFATVGLEGLTVLLEHGSFKASATNAVFVCSMIYIAGQQTNIIRDLIYRYFYATGNTKTPAGNSMLVAIINIIVSLILVRFFGVYGVVIGTVVASAVSLFRISLQFKRKIGFGLPVWEIIISFSKNILISLITIVVVLVTKKNIVISSCVGRMLVFGIETVILFCVLTFLIKRDTLTLVKNI